MKILLNFNANGIPGLYEYGKDGIFQSENLVIFSFKTICFRLYKQFRDRHGNGKKGYQERQC